MLEPARSFFKGGNTSSTKGGTRRSMLPRIGNTTGSHISSDHIPCVCIPRVIYDLMQCPNEPRDRPKTTRPCSVWDVVVVATINNCDRLLLLNHGMLGLKTMYVCIKYVDFAYPLAHTVPYVFLAGSAAALICTWHVFRCMRSY